MFWLRNKKNNFWYALLTKGLMSVTSLLLFAKMFCAEMTGARCSNDLRQMLESYNHNKTLAKFIEYSCLKNFFPHLS